jgi:hypothetical protein
MKIVIKIPKMRRRATWGFNPTTRVVKSKKFYNRNQEKTLARKIARKMVGI